MCNWDWNVISSFGSFISAIAASGALAITGWPKISGQFRKNKKIKRLNKIHVLNSENQDIFNENVKLLIISRNTIISNNISDLNPIDYEFIFYKFDKFFYIETDRAEINGIKIPKGFNFFEIINDYTIRLNIIDDTSGDLKNVLIHSSFTHELDKFKTITSWKNK